MDRRHFLKAMGAIAAGVGPRAVPVLGETHSELVPPKVFASAAVEPQPALLWGLPVLPPVPPDLRAYVLRPLDWTPIKVAADAATHRPAAFARIEGF
jgi:hypothetical protein